ncbi:methylenetetrahydrofolate reductase [Polymorphospora lycopeni]|uniref:5,10-methylenetetrahydrofolate reductase n=1 Tax=Polymorphospora lycopeni TaxID=3140240 RepID=A0ABV5D1E7_9ACTN
MTPALTANSQCRSGSRRAEVRIYLVVSRLELRDWDHDRPIGFDGASGRSVLLMSESGPLNEGEPAGGGPEVAKSPGLRDMLAAGDSGVMLFSLTPPKRHETEQRVKEIAAVTAERLARLPIDGLILYDIDDESDRLPEERPFPFLPTLDPAQYYADHLSAGDLPVVIYRCIGKYRNEELRDWLSQADPQRVLSVFVGPSSRDKPVRTDLRSAHAAHQQVRPELMLGGVVIGERHTRGHDEHLRMLAKQERGCSFFVSQVVYHVNETKNLISDYFYECRARAIAPRPVIFTLSVCGSLKTLEFVRWLGVDVPRWLENSIRYSSDPLAESCRQAVSIAQDLANFCQNLNMPYGFNVESVSIRKAEIDATVELAADVALLLGRGPAASS